jgi:phosphoribosylamine--glycine ligase
MQMRVLGITETCDLGSLYLRLLAEGHDVRVSVSEPLAAGTMEGLVPRTLDWRSELDWVRNAGPEGLILFEAVGFGETQDDLRRQGFNVIGGSAFGDRLEDDRTFAFQLLRTSGLRAPAVQQFANVEHAIADLEKRPRRCVFKVSAAAGETFVGTFPDGRDIVALLASRKRSMGKKFILMDFVAGVETGVGAYFDGDKFLRPACVDWEHKRFFAGDMGELTGEMGTIATFEGSQALFEATLSPLEPLLRDVGHVGYVNLNTIINDQGIWPLEFTCRFGYPGFAVLEPLQAIGWGDLFQIMARRDQVSFPVHDGFSACVVITTPPFPYSRHDVEATVGLPLLIDNVPPEHVHLGEAGLSGSQLVTSGVYGWTMVVTGTGATVHEAAKAAYANARCVHAPNGRYRLDIGDKLISGDLEKLLDWGWLKSTPPSRIASQIVR